MQHSNGLGPLVGQVQSELARAMRHAMDRHGLDLNYSQVQALRRLYARGPMSASELARALCYDAGALTRLLDQLEQRALITREPNPTDRRALRLSLSDAGQALSRKLIVISAEVLEHALAQLNDEERAHLVDYLHRILATLRAPEQA